jgi:hypothetical protein
LQILRGTQTRVAQERHCRNCWSTERNQAQEVFDAEGVTVVVYSMLRFKTSAELIEKGLDQLANIEREVSNHKVARKLVRLDFLEKIPMLVSSQSNNKKIRLATLFFATVAVNANLALTLKFCSEGIVKFMTSLLASYHDDDFTIWQVCIYFSAVSRVPEVKYRLRKRQLPVLLEAMMQKQCTKGRREELRKKGLQDFDYIALSMTQTGHSSQLL